MSSADRHLTRVIGPRAARLLHDALVRLREDGGSGSVVLPANVCPIVPLTCWRAGFRTDFIDIDLASQGMTAELVAARLRDPRAPKASGVIFVHPYGRVSDDSLSGVADVLESASEELFLIDDRCSLVPCVERPEAERFGDMILFSTGYAKRVDIGYGGFAWVPSSIGHLGIVQDFDEEAFEHAREFFREPTPRDKALVEIPRGWLDSRPVHEDQYVEQVLAHRDAALRHEREMREIYTSQVPEELHLGAEFEWRFNLLVDNPPEVLDAIFDAGLFASAHYPSIAQPVSGARMQNADSSGQRLVNLFTGAPFTAEMAEECAAIVGRVGRRLER